MKTHTAIVTDVTHLRKFGNTAYLPLPKAIRALLNWGIRIGLTLVGGGFVVGGLFVLARPSMDYISKQVGTVAEVAAVAS